MSLPLLRLSKMDLLIIDMLIQKYHHRLPHLTLPLVADDR